MDRDGRRERSLASGDTQTLMVAAILLEKKRRANQIIGDEVWVSSSAMPTGTVEAIMQWHDRQQYDASGNKPVIVKPTEAAPKSGRPKPS